MSYVVDALVQTSTIIVIAIIGTLIGFPLVKMGHGWGKIFGNHKFKSPEVLFLGFFVSIIVCGILFEFATPFVNILLFQVKEWIPAIIASFMLVLYLWFCNAYGFSRKIRVVIVFLVIIFCDICFVYATNHYLIRLFFGVSMVGMSYLLGWFSH